MKNRVLKSITHKMIDLVSEEINNEESQVIIKEKIINPLLKVIFQETNKYVYGLVLLICLSMLFSMLTLIMFLLSRFSFGKEI
jgi:hypothetical protein